MHRASWVCSGHGPSRVGPTAAPARPLPVTPPQLALASWSALVVKKKWVRGRKKKGSGCRRGQRTQRSARAKDPAPCFQPLFRRGLHPLGLYCGLIVLPLLLCVSRTDYAVVLCVSRTDYASFGLCVSRTDCASFLVGVYTHCTGAGKQPSELCGQPFFRRSLHSLGFLFSLTLCLQSCCGSVSQSGRANFPHRG